MTPREARSLLWRLAWPIAITGQLAAIAEGINIYWLGRLIGDDALAVEATLRPVLSCIGWMLLSVATGVSILVAQSVGARDGRGLVYVRSGVQLVIAASIVLAILILPFASTLAAWLAPRSVSADDVRAFGLPAVLLMTPGIALAQVVLYAAAAAGWTRLATVRMALDLVATAVLVPIFVALLSLGLVGAPLAQAFVQVVLFAWVWRTLYAQRRHWHLDSADAAPASDRPHRQILAVGVPLQGARIVTFACYAYLVQRVAEAGQPQIIGFGIALMMLFTAAGFVMAIGRAVGIAYGQAVGAKDGSRARIVLRTGLVIGTLLGAVLVVASYAVAEPLVSVFTSDPIAQARGGEAYRILALALIPQGAALVYVFAHAAVKASQRAAAISVVGDLLGLALVWLVPADEVLALAAWSIVVSNTFRLVLYALSFRRYAVTTFAAA